MPVRPSDKASFGSMYDRRSDANGQLRQILVEMQTAKFWCIARLFKRERRLRRETNEDFSLGGR